MSKYTETKKKRLFRGYYMDEEGRFHSVKNMNPIPPQERTLVNTFSGNHYISKGQIICNGRDKEGKMTYITG